MLPGGNDRYSALSDHLILSPLGGRALLHFTLFRTLLQRDIFIVEIVMYNGTGDTKIQTSQLIQLFLPHTAGVVNAVHLPH